METAEVKSNQQQTFTWSTPFFDLQFVDIRTKKDVSPNGTRQRSLTRRRDHSSRRDKSVGSEMNGNNDLETEKRILRYKEDRRKQLAAQVASRLHSNGSSSDEEPPTLDRRSYSEYKRRRRRERGAKSNDEKVSSRHNLNSSGGELHHSRSRGSPEPLKGGSDHSRVSSETRKAGSDPSRVSSEPVKVSPQSGKGSRASSASRTRGSRGSLESSHARFDSSHALQFDSSRALQFESSQALQFESSQALTRERAHPGHIRPRKGAESQGSAGGFSGKNASPEHIYQVISDRPDPSPKPRNRQELSTDSNSNSRDSLADRSGSRDSLGDRDAEREGLLASPDVIKTAVNQITPVPRRRQSDENFIAAKFPSKPNLELNLPKPNLDPAKPNLELRGEERPNLDLNSSRLNLANQNPESPGSVLSPTSVLSASKPPIFPTPDRSSGGFKFNLKKSGDSPPGFMRSDSRSDNEQPPVVKEFTGLVRRRSGQFTANEPTAFNPNEPAPPRPHSVYKMESLNKSRASDPDLHLPLHQKERRKSDFLTHYEELTCRAAMAIKTVDKIGTTGTIPLPSPLSPGSCLAPLSPGSCLPSPLSPGVESVEFNEEEVLKTCQDFLVDYNKSKQQSSNPSSYLLTSNPSSAYPQPTSSPTSTYLHPSQPPQNIPIPAPRLSLSGRRSMSQPSRPLSQPSRPVSQLSQEDEQLLEAAQNKQFWERGDGADKILRGRSSSFSMPDRRSYSYLDQQAADHSAVNLRPILKKSVEDLTYPGPGPLPSGPNSTISILKNRDDIFGKAKRRSAGEEGKNEHVRIRSPSPRTEHVRIRTPSPSSSGSPPRHIPRSRDNSFGDDRSDSEIPSILKRRASADDLQFEDYVGLSPEKSSILKRKASFGSTYSGSHSPEGVSEGTRSILKKSSRNSSRTCSRSASIEDLDADQTKSILKSRNSSRTCSRSGSQEDLDLDLEDEDDEWMEPKPKSILKKKQGSTDDELDDRPERPKSILKSRRSEESLSPSSEQFAQSDTPRSGRRFTRHASLPSDSEDIPSGRTSPLVQFPTEESGLRSTSAPGSRRRVREEGEPRPLRRDDGSLPGILKYREKSSSPTRETRNRSEKSSSPFRDARSRSDVGRSPHSAFETFSPRSSSSPRVSTPPPWSSSSPRVLTSPPWGSSSPRVSTPPAWSSSSPRVSTPPPWGSSSSPPPRGGREGTPPWRRGHSAEEVTSSWRRGHSAEDEDEILCIVEQRDINQLEVYDSPVDPSKMSLAERVQMFDSIGQNLGRPPRIGGATGAPGRRRRKQNPRFLTQPITVDEVEKARKGFMEPGARMSPLGGARTSPLYSMLRPVSLEEIVGEVLVPKPVKGVPVNIPAVASVNFASSNVAPLTGVTAQADQPSQPTSRADQPSQPVSRTVIRFSTANTTVPSTTIPGATPTSAGDTPTSPTRPVSASTTFTSAFTNPSGQLNQPSGQSNQPSGQPYQPSGQPYQPFGQQHPPSCHILPTSSVFRPVPRPRSPPIFANIESLSRHESSVKTSQRSYARSLSNPGLNSGHQGGFVRSPPIFTRSPPPPSISPTRRGSPPLPRRRSLCTRRSPPPQTISPPSSPSASSSLAQGDPPSANRFRQVASPPSLSDDTSPTVARPSAFRPVSSATSAFKSSSPPPPPQGGHSSFSSAFCSRGSAFRPVEQSGAELTPVTGPIPIWDANQENGLSTEDLPSILKNRDDASSSSPRNSVHANQTRVPKKSILKNDSMDEPTPAHHRGVLKKDTSLDAAWDRVNGVTSSRDQAAWDRVNGVTSSAWDRVNGVSNSRDQEEFTRERRPKSSPPVNRSYSGGSSSEDVCRSFTDVVIDPIPGQGRRSAPETPVKRGGGTRTPVIRPSSVRISAQGDLAGKLAKLSTQADNIKQRMSFDDKQELETDIIRAKRSSSSPPAPAQTPLPTINLPAPTSNPPPPSPTTHLPPTSPSSHLPPTPSAKTTSATSTKTNSATRQSRKSDLPRAEDFYAIYQQQKRRNSHSPAQSLSPGGASSGTPSPRLRLRQRSASPQCRKGVQFLEEKAAEIRRGISQEREMSARTEIQIQGGGIMDRLASLQKHGDEDWRQRAKKHKDDPLITRSSSESAEKKEKTSPTVQLRRPQGTMSPAARPVSLMDRLSKLNQAQTHWQTKVEDKDTKKFTVEGKMEREQLVRSVMSAEKHVAVTPVKPTPVTGGTTPLGSVNRLRPDRERCTPKMKIFQGSNTPVRTRPVSLFVNSDTKNTGSGVRRSNSMRKLESTQSSRLSLIETSPNKIFLVPDIMEETLDCDLDIVSSYKPSLNTRRTVAPPRRTRGCRNPVKRLMDREDLVVREEELRHTEDKENKLKVDKSAHSHLAAEALAGLASTEDFTSVQLRKDNKVSPNQNMQPHRQKMLIQVKGRRFCQCRLVEPVASSVNSGDSYILITPTELFNWQGKFSNVIERSRSAEVATTILQKKDLGCKKVSRVQTIEEEKMLHCSRENRRFWAALDPLAENLEPRPPGPPQEDEEYEQSMVEASCVYEVSMSTDELIPIEDNWGLPPKYSLLDPSKVLVFDFGSEVYCYSGKNASFDGRKVGARLAQELWTAGWDYTGCDLNPVYGTRKNMTESSRPDWTVLGRINSNMETILFREKFTDWPDKSRVIGKAANGSDKDAAAVSDVNTPPAWAWADLQGWTGADIRGLERLEPDLELEGSHLGRGREFYDIEERRQYIVETLGVKAWHVEENTSRPLPDTFSGQFHSEDTYVIRWKYKVALTGRNLKGGASKYSAVGRERCAYFFWQGEHSKISLQGASALQTVELDYEKGPQLRVPEGTEHAAFLSLFNGQMVIYRGRRGSTNVKEARLFLVRGQDGQETYLKELQPNPANLRASGVFILAKRGKLILWVGSHAAAHVVDMAEAAARRLAARLPAELGLGDSATVSTVRQGAETAVFMSALGATSNNLQHLTGCDTVLSCTPRLFHMTSVLGSFEVSEVLPDQMKLKVTNPLLFNQKTLYEAEQPGLFMFDCGSLIWLWQGWLEPDSETPNEGTVSGANTGSGLVRWHAERRAAMSSMLEYAREVRRAEGRAEVDLRLVWAGHEPQQFINLFPVWVQNEDVAIYNQDMLETPSVEIVYSGLSRTEYSWAELQERPFPPGVDPARIEQYLSISTFQEKFKTSKDEFSALPRWKQIEMKKDIGLF